MKESNEEIKNELQHESEMLSNKINQIETVTIDDNKLLDEKLISCIKEVEQGSKRLSSLDAGIGKLKTQINQVENKVKANRSHIDKSINKKKWELDALTERVGGIEERIGDDLEGHIMNIENILFRYDSLLKYREIKFKWVMKDYKEKFKIGKDVYSPIFYPEVDGYCFKLRVSWKGEKKETIGVYLCLCQGKSKMKTLPPFNHEYTVGLHTKDGISEVKISYEELIKFRDECFIIRDGKEEAEKQTGCEISSPFDDYIINDSLFLSFTLYV